MITDPVTDPAEVHANNLALWEGLAALHGGGLPGYYDLEAIVAGKNPIQSEVDTTLTVALGDGGVAGLDVLHVQSHIAVDSVELARRGARVTCADFSPTALAKAAELAAACGVTLDLVQADSTDLPASLHGRFDVAYATVGVLCWIKDIDAWMRSVTACLRPGGTLVLVEIHPLRQMTDELDPLTVDMSYTFEPDGLSFDEDGSYADPNATLPATKGTVYSHSLGETVTAAVDAGLGIVHLREWTENTFDAMGENPKVEEDGMLRWRLTPEAPPFPILFGLVARKA